MPLPLPLTRFFGREAELRVLAARLNPPANTAPPARLITLLGSGGGGKTRLALEAASRLREAAAFGGNVYFVPLADALPTVDALAGAIRAALPAQGAPVSAASSGDAVSAVVAALGNAAALLVLDNFEHLADVDAISDFLRRLLTASPHLSLLVTSRRLLDIEGEQEIAVSPLPTVAAGDPAGAKLEAIAAAPGAQLLLDRMQAVRPNFVLTTENAPAVAALCERLEGIPLAIVLCAAWAGTLSPAQMLERLRNRFDLLVSRRKDIPERHRTLRATVEYSYQQLTPELERLLTGLSIFRGGWTLEAAVVVADATIEDLDFLRERSMIVADEGADGAMRYRMLETLREFAQILGSDADTSEAERRHAAFFLAFAEQAASNLSGPEQATWLSRLQTEHDNLRAALAWCLNNNAAELGLRLCVAITGFWEVRRYLNEGLDWMRRMAGIALPPDLSSALTARFGLAEFVLHQARGDSETALLKAETALALYEASGDDGGTARALNSVANAFDTLSRIEDARAAYLRSLALSRRLGNDSLTASVLSNLGKCDYADRRWEEAKALFSEALAIFTRLGHRRHQATVLNNLGITTSKLGDLDTAIAYLTESLTIRRSLGDKDTLTMINLGNVFRLRGRASAHDYGVPEARALLREALAISNETGTRHMISLALRGIGQLDGTEGDWRLGIYRIAAADVLLRSLRVNIDPDDLRDPEEARAAARLALGDAAMETAWEAGTRADLAAVVGDALAG